MKTQQEIRERIKVLNQYIQIHKRLAVAAEMNEESTTAFVQNYVANSKKCERDALMWVIGE